MEIRSSKDRQYWAQFDALEMGSGWDETDISKPQILIDDVYGDSHPGSTHLGRLSEQAKYGVLKREGILRSITARISAMAVRRAEQACRSFWLHGKRLQIWSRCTLRR